MESKQSHGGEQTERRAETAKQFAALHRVRLHLHCGGLQCLYAGVQRTALELRVILSKLFAQRQQRR